MAMLAFLKAKALPLPGRVMTAFDLRAKEIPPLTPPSWQRLLAHYLADRDAAEGTPAAAHRNEIARRLRERSLLTRNQLQMASSTLVRAHMTQSVAKIDACVQVHHLEREVRGAGLRQVILTDYIRAAGVVDGGPDSQSIGAWPIFRRIASGVPEADRRTCALLTGGLVVVHQSLEEVVRPACDSFAELADLPGFHRVVGGGPTLVAALTECMSRGLVHCLVGTRALLGEGWDAPAVNSLVLASNVGSYMLTNQMRGRAIRVDKNDPDKIASIWHLLAVVLDRRPFDSLLGESAFFWPGLADLRELEARFTTFAGVDCETDVIRNDLARLHLPFLKSERDSGTGVRHENPRPEAFRSAGALLAHNGSMADRLRNLARVRESWQRAIDRGTQGRLVPTMTTDRPPRIVPFRWAATLTALLTAAFGIFTTSAHIMSTLNVPRIGIPLWGIAVVAFLLSAPVLLRALYLGVRHLPIDGSLRQIGIALRDTLCAAEVIEGSPGRLRVQSSWNGGEARVSLVGGTYHEQSIFADCMREIVGPVGSPRHLIVRYGSWLGIRRKDYHAVPARIGAHKENAEIFVQAWRRSVGPADLVYTRAPENRALLLRARVKSFSAGAAKAAERTDCWL